jgi:hypothetical membrane protein
MSSQWTWNDETVVLRMKRWHVYFVVVVIMVFFLLAIVRILFASAFLDRAWVSFLLRFMIIQVFLLSFRCVNPHIGCRIEEVLLISGIGICFYYAFIAPNLFPDSTHLDI